MIRGKLTKNVFYTRPPCVARFDSNYSGTLDMSELACLLSAMGWRDSSEAEEVTAQRDRAQSYILSKKVQKNMVILAVNVLAVDVSLPPPPSI